MKKTLISFLLITDLFSQTYLEYLNSLRNNVGMTSYKENNLLNISAYNHAKYVAYNNQFGHTESSSYLYFTGIWPNDRAYFVGYGSTLKYIPDVSENGTAGEDNYIDSIDGLFTAIYHRFGFLDFSKDEIGMGREKNSNGLYYYFYNMGNSIYNGLCSGNSYTGQMSTLDDFCKDSTFRVETPKLRYSREYNVNLNPDIVIWPYENQQDFTPVFYEEIPDPLPTCGVTGDPISIQFNELKVGTITMNSFKLYDENNIEITNTKILDKNSDPNHKFTKYEFALFPMERLNWDTKYSAVFSYNADGIDKEKRWNFKTKSTGYTTYKMSSNEETFNVENNKTYAIYIPPLDCNDSKYHQYPLNYSTSSSTINQYGWLDANTLLFNISGNIGDVFDVVMDNGKKIHLKIVETLQNSTQQKAFVERFYQNIMGRTADSGGMTTWLNTIQNESATKVALGFFKSQEFINKNLSNEQFVDILYSTLFDRQADSSGRTGWLNQLNSGTSKDEVMYGFFNAQEFKNLADRFGVTQIRPEDQLNAGSTGVDGYVNRFYTLVLNRNADTSGFTDWTTQLNSGTKAGGDIAKGFFNSAEYNNRGLDNSTFLDICYRAFFNREADAGGKSNWTTQLSQGATKDQILDGFIDSQEFITLANSFGIKNKIVALPTIIFNGLEYGIVTSPITGRQWLDRNLGASRVCTSSNDEACYGDYYQWGRLADGHEKANSATTSTLATGITSVGSSFIRDENSPDWTTADSNGSQRTAQWSKTDGTGVCPVGFRVPTQTELANETTGYTGSDNTSTGAVKVTKSATTAFSNFLKFPVAGSHDQYSGSVRGQGLWGDVWSNSVFGSASMHMDFHSGGVFWSGYGRVGGFSVRCVEN